MSKVQLMGAGSSWLTRVDFRGDRGYTCECHDGFAVGVSHVGVRCRGVIVVVGELAGSRASLGDAGFDVEEGGAVEDVRSV